MKNAQYSLNGQHYLDRIIAVATEILHEQERQDDRGVFENETRLGSKACIERLRKIEALLVSNRDYINHVSQLEPK